MTTSRDLHRDVTVAGSRVTAALNHSRRVRLISPQPVSVEQLEAKLTDYVQALSRYRRSIEAAIPGELGRPGKAEARFRRSPAKGLRKRPHAPKRRHRNG